MMPEGPSFPVCSTFVQELFQAQYRSSLTCPHCQKQSNTFDPFLCISLPIPLPHTRPLYVTVVYQGKCSHCMRIGVAVPLSGTVARLREAVSMETKIPTDQTTWKQSMRATAFLPLRLQKYLGLKEFSAKEEST